MDDILDILVDLMDDEINKCNPFPDRFRPYFFGNPEFRITNSIEEMIVSSKVKPMYWKMSSDELIELLLKNITKKLLSEEILSEEILIVPYLESNDIPDEINKRYTKIYDILDVIICTGFYENSTKYFINTINELLNLCVNHKIIVRFNIYMSIHFTTFNRNKSSMKKFIRTMHNKINEFIEIPASLQYFLMDELNDYLVFLEKRVE